MGKANALPDYPRGLTFEKVWAALMEDRELLRQNAAEHDKQQREIVEQQKEAAKRHDEIDRIVKENAKLIGNLGHRYGEMIEYMVKPNLVDKFREQGFVFTKVHQSTNIKDIQNNIIAQIDFSLEDGDKVMIVEVNGAPSQCYTNRGGSGKDRNHGEAGVRTLKRGGAARLYKLHIADTCP